MAAFDISACETLDEVRSHINRIDRRLVACLAERGAYVTQAARFKKSAADVHAPARVEQVIMKAVALAKELDANVAVTEQVYRAMIAAFIEAELVEQVRLRGALDGPGADT